MTVADELRAAIARDCPHRLDDYDDHRAAALARGWGQTYATRIHWWTEHHISADPNLEERYYGLYEQAAGSDTRDEALRCIEEASRIWGDVQQQVIKEMDVGVRPPKEHP
ncbi:hypothetical protein ABT264_35170 [Streptomyces virginiae]|uniref:hypothetical protein n=1 Tax=Streptomyces virginiae TaxID=1961 RepID=UPI00332491E0